MPQEMVWTPEKKTEYAHDPLFGRGKERTFSGKSLAHCEMPLGPMGCGSVSLSGRGHLCAWRVLGGPMAVERLPLTFFAVRAQVGGRSTARLLQLDRVGSLPTVDDIELVGEFPLARLRYVDAALPVEVSMEAFSPFIPPHSRESCTPAIAFTFMVKNPGKKRAEVSLLASQLNGIGLHSMARLTGPAHGGFGGNVNVLRQTKGLTAIAMSVRETAPAPARPDIVFEDFESGEFNGWTVEGSAFGDHPTSVDDRRLSPAFCGYRGKRLALSSDGSQSEATGKITSPAFTVDRDAIHFLIGGGRVPGKTCINLLVDGDVVRTATGDGSDRLVRKRWDVADLAGKRAVIEIVDAETESPYGYVLVDHNVFSDVVPVVAEEPFVGTMALATTAPGATHTTQYANLKKLWDDFSADGALDPSMAPKPSKAGRTYAGALAAPITVEAGRSKTVTFILTWHFPNRKAQTNRGDHRIGMAYNNWFGSAADVLDYVAGDFKRLRGGTKAFHDSLYKSTLPSWLMDVVGQQLAVLPSPTCVWCENDDFGFWEGVAAFWCCCAGCCGINCMHVLNYSMIPAILFPDRERSIRRLNVQFQQGEDGRFFDKYYSGFPPERPKWDNIDNACGFPINVYRDYLWSGDRGALDIFWPAVKKAMGWLLSLDTDGNGIPNMRREPGSHKCYHTTYDEWTMYGTSSFIGSYWLAALKAAEQIALLQGETRTAQAYCDLFARAVKSFDDELWNGEYYKLFHDRHYDRERLTEYDQCCMSDQIIGQWYTHVLGLGPLLPKDRVHSAMEAVYRYNWYDDYEYESKVTEARLCLYTHPRGAYRTYGPFKHPEEDNLLHGESDGHYRNWVGAELSMAAHMIYEGLLEKGLAIARGVFDRYDGTRANPWKQIECGAYYSRGMSSWTLLLAAAGHQYDAARGFVAFAPRFTPENFRCFWSGFGGWGTFSQTRKAGRQTHKFELKHGSVELKEFAFELPAEKKAAAKAIRCKLAGRTVAARLTREGRTARVVLDERHTLDAGHTLEIVLDV